MRLVVALTSLSLLLACGDSFVTFSSTGTADGGSGGKGAGGDGSSSSGSTGGSSSTTATTTTPTDTTPTTTSSQGGFGASGQGASGQGAGGPGGSGQGAGGQGAGGGGNGGSGGGGSIKKCRGLAFASGARVTIADHPNFDGFGPMAIEAWIRSETLQGQGELVHHQGGNAGWLFEVKNSNALTLRGWFLEGVKGTGGDGNSQVPKLIWRHVAGTFDGTKMRVFVQGKLTNSIGVTTQGPMVDFAGPVLIGSAAGGAMHFIGTMDAVRISKVARYTADFTPPTKLAIDKDTVALWTFDEQSGQKVVDETGKHNGVLGTGEGQELSDPLRVEYPCLADSISDG